VLNLLRQIRHTYGLYECIDYIRKEISELWRLDLDQLLLDFIIETASGNGSKKKVYSLISYNQFMYHLKSTGISVSSREMC
jgi:hypothetical protein